MIQDQGIERTDWGWRLYVSLEGFGKYFRVDERTWGVRSERGGVREMGGRGPTTPPHHTFLAMVAEAGQWARRKRRERTQALAYAQGDPPD